LDTEEYSIENLTSIQFAWRSYSEITSSLSLFLHSEPNDEFPEEHASRCVHALGECRRLDRFRIVVHSDMLKTTVDFSKNEEIHDSCKLVEIKNNGVRR
jgi:hypothetical protein